jgi:hypothetical protein
MKQVKYYGGGSYVVCDGSASKIAFNSLLLTWVSRRPRGLFYRSKFPERKRWNQKRTVFSFATQLLYTPLPLPDVFAALVPRWNS